MGFQRYVCLFPSHKYNDHYLDDIKEALKNKTPYSWIRIGDGEIGFLEQEYVYPLDQINKRYCWGTSNFYCGATLPNIPLRDRLINAIKESTLVGIFLNDEATMNVLSKIDIAPININYAFDNVFLPMNAKFVNMISKAKFLLVGKDSTRYAQKLKEMINNQAVGTIPISGYEEIERTMDDMMNYDFDLALVSAGVNAKVICNEMVKRKNAVYLDMGHAWDNAFHKPGSFDEYFLIPIWQGKFYKPNELVIYNDKLYKNFSDISLNSNPSNDDRWIVIEDNL